MSSVRFNLRGTKNNKPQPIYLIFRHQNVKVVFNTGFKVLPKFWNNDSQKIRNVTDIPKRDFINAKLGNFRNSLLSHCAEMKSKNQPITKDKIKAFLTGADKVESFFDFVDKFVEDTKKRTNPTTGKYFSRTIHSQYRLTLAALKEFERATNKTISYSSFDDNFYNEFVNFLKGKKLSTNTIGGRIKTLKIFLNAALDKGYKVNMTFKRKYKVLKEESDSIYLTESELAKIYAIDLKDNQRLKRVRDLFLIGAWTGLRFSDFTNIKPENIKLNKPSEISKKGIGSIQIRQQKTDIN